MLVKVILLKRKYFRHVSEITWLLPYRRKLQWHCQLWKIEQHFKSGNMYFKNSWGWKIHPKGNYIYYCKTLFSAKREKLLRSKFVTDRQTDKYFDTLYRCVWIFSSSWICYLPTRFACRGIHLKFRFFYQNKILIVFVRSESFHLERRSLFKIQFFLKWNRRVKMKSF